MGKQTVGKPGGQVVKRSGVVKTKASPFVKKNDKKRAQTSSEPNLRQPKNRDPGSSISVTSTSHSSWSEGDITDCTSELNLLWETGAKVQDFLELTVIKPDDFQWGNNNFLKWHKDYLQHWNQKCDRCDFLFSGYFGTKPCHSLAAEFFENLNDSLEQGFQFLPLRIFYTDKLHLTSEDEYSWSVRCLAMQLAQQSPFQLFDINELPSSSNPFWTDQAYAALLQKQEKQEHQKKPAQQNRSFIAEEEVTFKYPTGATKEAALSTHLDEDSDDETVEVQGEDDSPARMEGTVSLEELKEESPTTTITAGDVGTTAIGTAQNADYPSQVIHQMEDENKEVSATAITPSKVIINSTDNGAMLELTGATGTEKDELSTPARYRKPSDGPNSGTSFMDISPARTPDKS